MFFLCLNLLFKGFARQNSLSFVYIAPEALRNDSDP